MSLITIQNLNFTYDGSYEPVFQDVSFQIDTRWKLGLIGRNGRGKTTFLNLLRGTLDCGGAISHSVDFSYFPYEAPGPESTPTQIAAAICPDAQEWELLREFGRLQLGEDVLSRPFRTLSNGERTKALLAILFLREDRFLLIDEPTNHLDAPARALVSDYLNTKQGFILVSHDRAFLDGCVDHILSINRADIEVQRGNFSSWYENKERRDNFERAENEKLSREITHLSEAARRASGWSDKLEKTKTGLGQDSGSGLRPDRGFIGHKSAKMMKRAKNIEARKLKAAGEKQGLLHNVETVEELKVSPLSYHTDRLALLDDVQIYYGEAPACAPVSLMLERGQRIALQGPNGCGKSSILKLLAGESLPHTGTFLLGGNLRVSYVPQDTSHLQGSLKDFARSAGIDLTLFLAILRKLDFSRTQFERKLEEFSGGQKKKVLIARSLCEKAHLYLWDEPLNFIDLFSRMQIEQLLLESRPTLVFVEHDQAFVDTIATRTIRFGQK